jgi:hypothetical protein
LIGCRNLDGFTGAWIATLGRGTLGNAESAETNQTDFLSALEGIRYR